MDTKAAENYLRNTEMKFKFKAGSAMAIALTLLVTIILEEIIGMPVHPLEDVYFIGGIILLVVTGGIVKDSRRSFYMGISAYTIITV